MKDAEPSNEVSATVECGKISTSEREGQGVGVFRERYGGREELMKLALSDLEKAVEVDPEGEDVRRQRDHLKREIEEEKVMDHGLTISVAILGGATCRSKTIRSPTLVTSSV